MSHSEVFWVVWKWGLNALRRKSAGLRPGANPLFHTSMSELCWDGEPDPARGSAGRSCPSTDTNPPPLVSPRAFPTPAMHSKTLQHTQDTKKEKKIKSDMEYHGSISDKEGHTFPGTAHGGSFTPGEFHGMMSAANGLLSREEHCTIT